jgi:multidrug efflux pump subunit AcrA (membrane-fusion protein)
VKRCLGATLCMAALTLPGCSKTSSPDAPGAAAAGAAAPAPPALVTAMQVIQRDASVTSDLVGAVSAIREVPLRAQVSGTLDRILFEPGQRVPAVPVIDSPAARARVPGRGGEIHETHARRCHALRRA